MVITDVPHGSYIKAAANAVEPWNSADAMMTFNYHLEPQPVIDRCLTCDYAECWNCIERERRLQMRKLKADAKLAAIS